MNLYNYMVNLKIPLMMNLISFRYGLKGKNINIKMKCYQELLDEAKQLGYNFKNGKTKIKLETFINFQTKNQKKNIEYNNYITDTIEDIDLRDSDEPFPETF